MSKELRMPNVGETVKGKYCLQSVLGEGGFGKAFSGVDREYNNFPVAMKFLKLNKLQDTSKAVLDFTLEAFLMTELQHQNLVPIIDYNPETETLPYIVMPLAANGSLGGEIKTRRGSGEPMPFERSIIAIEQTGDALGYLHQRRIVHQDVKPDNILEPNETDFWLSDLGIARILKPNDSLRTLHMGFSPQYVSPEQSHGKAEPASDQYSLGVTAYLLLSGRLPFITSLGGDAGAAELVHLHRTAQPISLVEAIQSLKKGERILDVLRALDPVVMKALAKKT